MKTGNTKQTEENTPQAEVYGMNSRMPNGYIVKEALLRNYKTMCQIIQALPERFDAEVVKHSKLDPPSKISKQTLFEQEHGELGLIAESRRVHQMAGNFPPDSAAADSIECGVAYEDPYYYEY